MKNIYTSVPSDNLTETNSQTELFLSSAPSRVTKSSPRFVHDLPSTLAHGLRVCLFGASSTGLGQKRLLDVVRPDVRVVAFADSQRTGVLDGVPVLSLEEYLFRQGDFDLTVITSHACVEIGDILESRGVRNYTRFRGVAESAPFAEVDDGPSAACVHSWAPYPAAVNRYRMCTACGAVNKYLVAPWCRPHDDYGKDYWSDFHLVDGIPQNRLYERELLAALEEIGTPLNALGRSVLEIGAGLGRLVPMFLRNGWTYTALEPSAWAARFIADAYSVPVYNRGLDDLTADAHLQFDMVLSLHTLEHLPRADKGFERLLTFIKPGGHLMLVLPDAEDLLNIDHVWFFSERVLDTWAKNLGLELVGITRLRPFHAQDNIYFVARKPR